ncbi:MAG: FAD-dependent oxidoreductase [Devosia sp.]
MSQPHRLAADAAHHFGGIELDRSKPLQFRLNGRTIDGFAGDTVLSAVLAAGIHTYGLLGDASLGLTESFAPLVSSKGGSPLPMQRLLASDGLDLISIGRRKFGLGWAATLRHIIDGIADAPWLRTKPERTLATDLLVIGGGVAGLAAADTAATAGRSVILIERRNWLGGDARYFGAVGDEESPEAVTNALIATLRGSPNVTLMMAAEAFALTGLTAHVHRIEAGRGEVIEIEAKRIVLATGSLQRLAIFSGNRGPGVASTIAVYHLAKRYGVTRGKSAVVATQSNFGYRLALRLHDAGIAIGRIVDSRINPQSRFVDFAKASGLTLSGGHVPVAAIAARHTLGLAFAPTGAAAPSLNLTADQLIVSGTFQPDLALWMLAGGGTHWHEGRLLARGQVENIALVGSAAGYRSMRACVESGRVTDARLWQGTATEIADLELGAAYETEAGPTMLGPNVDGPPAFFDSGASLIARPAPNAKPLLTGEAHAPSIGDVAASVELGTIAAVDAGAVAEERGAPGADLVASNWTAPTRDADEPAWLASRFGPAPQRPHLMVDAKRKFERGALVYANSSRPDPVLAIGVIVAAPPDGLAGGIALISQRGLTASDRFIVETLDGPSPARIRSA